MPLALFWWLYVVSGVTALRYLNVPMYRCGMAMGLTAQGWAGLGWAGLGWAGLAGLRVPACLRVWPACLPARLACLPAAFPCLSSQPASRAPPPPLLSCPPPQRHPAQHHPAGRLRRVLAVQQAPHAPLPGSPAAHGGGRHLCGPHRPHLQSQGLRVGQHLRRLHGRLPAAHPQAAGEHG